jgi:hypothetical protein
MKYGTENWCLDGYILDCLVEELKKRPQNAVVEFECCEDYFNDEIRDCETRHYETGES